MDSTIRQLNWHNEQPRAEQMVMHNKKLSAHAFLWLDVLSCSDDFHPTIPLQPSLRSLPTRVKERLKSKSLKSLCDHTSSAAVKHTSEYILKAI